MKTFVVGDIHGALPALKQVLERSKFNKEEDCLVCLGDVCDGWPYVRECFDELLTIPKLLYVMGNHDWWAYEFFAKKGIAEEVWLKQGGSNTIKSYSGTMPEEHIQLLREAQPCFEFENTKGQVQVFTHGGINPDLPIYRQLPSECMWDRHLLQWARNRHNKTPDYKYGGYEDIFVGHTTTQVFKTLKPVHFCNVWDIDTGAGWNGVLTIMDVDSKEYWQSDNVLDLMPNEQGRALRF